MPRNRAPPTAIAAPAPRPAEEAQEEPVEVVESYMFSHTGADDVPDCR
jgi:hypothetical protein